MRVREAFAQRGVITFGRYLNLLLILLFVLCIGRLWLMPLPSSFWQDETGTVFVARYGVNHPSVVAPAAWKSIYYSLPTLTDRYLGHSEIAYRLPSLLGMSAALLIIVRIAMRLIGPQAGWLACFSCLLMPGINFQAGDARPYALGTFVAAAAVWFLIRWLDTASWHDMLPFVVFAALLWRIHLVFWPFYIVLFVYAVGRVWLSDTTVSWQRILLVFAAIGVSLVPVAIDALALAREASQHVFARMPSLKDLRLPLALGRIVILVAVCAFCRLFWRERGCRPSASSLILIVVWWVTQPVALFAYSRMTGNSLFAPHYMTLALPGAALVLTAGIACLAPATYYNAAAALVAMLALASMGEWNAYWPQHASTDYRDAAAAVNRVAGPGDIPVICLSPFIEARPPVWTPDYRLPGFLYANLTAYPISGKLYLLPYVEDQQYAAEALLKILPKRHFIVYGADPVVVKWKDLFAAQPELAKWHHRPLGSFGTVQAELFEGPRDSTQVDR